MRLSILAASAAALALTACGDGRSDEANLATATGNGVENVADLATNGAAPAAATASSGQEYVDMAGGSDMYETEAARIALEKSQNDDVRELAQMIQTDHQRSTQELQTAAQQAQPPLTVAPAMTPEQQANIEALQAATGAAFDQTYLNQQVTAHEKGLTLVQDYAQNGDVPSLKQHASTVSGPIQQHLDRARELVNETSQ